MKRIVRLSLAVMFGLYLGWVAVGYTPLSLDGAAPAIAADPAAAADDHHAEEPHHDHAEQSDHGAHAAGAEKHKTDAGQETAGQLSVAADDVPWLRPVLWGVAGLFAAALTFGYAALKFRGPEPVDPAAHDSHGDDHAHAAHH